MIYYMERFNYGYVEINWTLSNKVKVSIEV